MEYNKAKRGLELGAAITAIIYCLIDLIFELIAYEELLGAINYLKEIYEEEYYSYMHSTVVAYKIGFFIGVALVIFETIFAFNLLKKPIKNENGFISGEYSFKKELKQRKRIRVFFIVFSSILTFFMLINCFLTSETAGSLVGKVIGLLIFTTIIVLESIAMSMKDFNEKIQATKETTVSANLSIEQKISELKHLKELGVINDEQYKNAVDKNVRDII